MHKKLMAVAVAGALAAPAVALAQTTIYGRFNAEYGIASQPNAGAAPGTARHDAEAFNSGSSRIGFRGEEKMGGGLAAWYQCESNLRFLAGTTRTSGSICDRDSAIGIKGGFGNVYFGSWNAPIKRAAGVTRITNRTGWLGSEHITLESPAGPASFAERYPHSINYDTPNWGGFSANVQFTSLQATRDATATAVAEGRVMGLGGQYAAGPLVVVVGYETRDENRATGSLSTSEDTAWLVGATYVFGPVKVGLTYTSMETQPTATTTLERTAWNLAADWRLGGPHMLRFGYAQADDLEGTAAAGAGGTAAAGAGPNTGAKQYQISYLYSFSKRTQLTIGYIKLDNDSAGSYNLAGLTAGAPGSVSAGFLGVTPGDSADAFMFGLEHRF